MKKKPQLVRTQQVGRMQSSKGAEDAAEGGLLALESAGGIGRESMGSSPGVAITRGSSLLIVSSRFRKWVRAITEWERS